MTKRIYTDEMRAWNAQYRLDHLEEIKEKQRVAYWKNKQKHDEYHRKYYLKNRAERLAKQKEYYKNNKAKVLKYLHTYQVEKTESDLNYRLARQLRSRMKHALRNDAKTGSAVRELGCTIPELRMYIEGQFKDGMTWQNWGLHGWHIDHKIPLRMFDLSDKEQFLQACHYTNLQPLWAFDNLSKGAR